MLVRPVAVPGSESIGIRKFRTMGNVKIGMRNEECYWTEAKC